MEKAWVLQRLYGNRAPSPPCPTSSFSSPSCLPPALLSYFFLPLKGSPSSTHHWNRRNKLFIMFDYWTLRTYLVQQLELFTYLIHDGIYLLGYFLGMFFSFESISPSAQMGVALWNEELTLLKQRSGLCPQLLGSDL